MVLRPELTDTLQPSAGLVRRRQREVGQAEGPGRWGLAEAWGGEPPGRRWPGTQAMAKVMAAWGSCRPQRARRLPWVLLPCLSYKSGDTGQEGTKRPNPAGVQPLPPRLRCSRGLSQLLCKHHVHLDAVVLDGGLRGKAGDFSLNPSDPPLTACSTYLRKYGGAGAEIAENRKASLSRPLHLSTCCGGRATAGFALVSSAATKGQRLTSE